MCHSEDRTWREKIEEEVARWWKVVTERSDDMERQELSETEARGRREEFREPNMGVLERGIAILTGAWVARRTFGHGLGGLLGGSAVAGALSLWGVSGHCPMYRALGVTGEDAGPLSHPFSRTVLVHRSTSVTLPAEEVLALLSLPEILAELSPGTPAPGSIEVSPELPRRWRSREGVRPAFEGVVEVSPISGRRGSELHITVRVRPPAGILGAGAAFLQGASPETEVREGLRRVKQFLETGELTTNRSTGSAPATRGEA